MKQGFYAHNKENERETKLITRSSAIFHFICNENINTEIHYLNYWLIKRGVSDIIRHITLRNMDGKKLFKTIDNVVTSGGQKINVQTILEKNDITVDKGSIEVEFFSETNLFVAYPALVVRYVSENWHKVDEIPNVPIPQIRLRKEDRALFAFTHGRGIWYLKLKENLSSIKEDRIAETNIYPNPASTDVVKVSNSSKIRFVKGYHVLFLKPLVYCSQRAGVFLFQ